MYDLARSVRPSLHLCCQVVFLDFSFSTLQFDDISVEIPGFLCCVFVYG